MMLCTEMEGKVLGWRGRRKKQCGIERLVVLYALDETRDDI